MYNYIAMHGAKATYSWHSVRFTVWIEQVRVRDHKKKADDEDLHHLHASQNNIFYLYSITCQYGQGFPFPGFWVLTLEEW